MAEIDLTESATRAAAGQQRRALTGLGPRRGTGEPVVSRLRRDARPAAPVEALPAAAPARLQPAARPAAAPVAAPAPAVRAPVAPAPQAPAADEAEALPRYLQLVRKEARVTQEQADWLATEVRRINSSRRRRDGVVGERITDNTLIRVALDLLRARGEELAGTTEDELIRSVVR